MPPVIAQRGFTLTELLVGIAIMALVLALGLPGFTEWIQNLQIRNAAEAMVNGLQLARSEAVNRNAPVQFKLDDAGPGWTVGCVTAVEPACPATIQKRYAGDGSSSKVTVAAADGKTIVFDSLGQMSVSGSTVTSTAFNIDTTALSAAQSRDLRVTVDFGGNIRMCDPNVTAADDPRKC